MCGRITRFICRCKCRSCYNCRIYCGSEIELVSQSTGHMSRARPTQYNLRFNNVVTFRASLWVQYNSQLLDLWEQYNSLRSMGPIQFTTEQYNSHKSMGRIPFTTVRSMGPIQFTCSNTIHNCQIYGSNTIHNYQS